MRRKLFTITLAVILLSCSEPVQFEQGRGVVVSIYPKDNSQECTYKLDFLPPYLPPSKMEFVDMCGKYTVGQVVKI